MNLLCGTTLSLLSVPKVLFSTTEGDAFTKIALARQIMINEGLALAECFTLVVRLDKRALAARIGVLLPAAAAKAAAKAAAAPAGAPPAAKAAAAPGGAPGRGGGRGGRGVGRGGRAARGRAGR